MNKITKLIRDWPVLAFHLEIPFVYIRTALFMQSQLADSYEYIQVEIKIYKWIGGFRLYKNRIWN